MPKKRLERALELLCRSTPDLLERWGFMPDSCVLMTRVAVLALTSLGVRATPFPVRMDVYSPGWLRAMQEGWDPTQAAMPAWSVDQLQAYRAWVVQVGHPDGEHRLRPNGRRGFNAHLLALVENRYLVDTTLHQAARPKHDIAVAPHWFPADRGMLRGELTTQVILDGSLIQYRRLDDPSYLSAPDWIEVRPGAAEVRDVRELLASVLF